jgi:hypothetical protein
LFPHPNRCLETLLKAAQQQQVRQLKRFLQVSSTVVRSGGVTATGADKTNAAPIVQLVCINRAKLLKCFLAIVIAGNSAAWPVTCTHKS